MYTLNKGGAMFTVENARLRVTVSDEVVARFQGGPRGRHETEDQALRGRILSNAMEKIGNQSELALMYSEGVSTDEVFKVAFMDLFRQYLERRGKYNVCDVVGRYLLGARMSEGMALEKDLAVAYAHGVLAPVSDDESRKELQDYVLSMHPGAPLDARAVDTIKQKMMLRRNAAGECATKALADAAATVLTFHQAEMRYRNARSNMEGWTIEIIGEMPDIIGVCRVTQ